MGVDQDEGTLLLDAPAYPSAAQVNWIRTRIRGYFDSISRLGQIPGTSLGPASPPAGVAADKEVAARRGTGGRPTDRPGRGTAQGSVIPPSARECLACTTCWTCGSFRKWRPQEAPGRHHSDATQTTTSSAEIYAQPFSTEGAVLSAERSRPDSSTCRKEPASELRRSTSSIAGRTETDACRQSSG